MGFERDLFMNPDQVEHFICSICLGVFGLDALQVNCF
jgi:hypothetical protein